MQERILLIIVTDKRQFNTLLPNIQNQIAATNKAHSTNMQAVIVDATAKPSVLKL